MKILLNIILFLLIIFLPSFTEAQFTSHLDWQKLPGGCASCHVGHGKPGTAMLPLSEEEFCYQCHGDFNQREKLVRENKLSLTTQTKNLRNEFYKPYHHPVEIKSENSIDAFDQKNRIYNVARAECLDCHRGHGISRVPPPQGIVLKQSPKNEGEFEFQLCYQCHSSLNQLSLSQRDINTWLVTTNPSFHPIESMGKNRFVPSLISPYDITSMINCTDCHGNDDPNGPRGPHGSIYEYILERNYNTNDFIPESQERYALCYKCHERSSILSDESFPLHNLHIAGTMTSCFTCHSSHGSQRNAHLIKFNEIVDPLRIRVSSSGRLEFIDTGILAGECYLTCHGVDHNPKIYKNSHIF